MGALPDPRRIVTTHDSKGNAIVLKDSRIPMLQLPTVNCDFAVLWETDRFPASNDGDDDPIERTTKSLANDQGLVLRIVDFPPRTEGLDHRTVSLDFGIVFSGELDCVLDNGLTVHLKPGDTFVQRGTVHRWTNNGDVPTRVYFLLTGILPSEVQGCTMVNEILAANPITINGETLGNYGFHDDEVATTHKS